MPKLLAIDTSSTNCTVALRSAGQCVSQTLDTGTHTAQQVLVLVSQVLTKAETDLQVVDAIAVMAGPGSFTGIRIGMGAAQGLSLANDTPVIPLSILALKAFTALNTADSTNLQQALVCDIAREGEVYFAAYRADKTGGVHLLGEEQVGSPQEMQITERDEACSGNWLGVGNGWEVHQDLPALLNATVTLPAFDKPLDSAMMCELALLRWQRGDAVAAEQALPNYVKDSLDYAR